MASDHSVVGGERAKQAALWVAGAVTPGKVLVVALEVEGLVGF